MVDVRVARQPEEGLLALGPHELAAARVVVPRPDLRGLGRQAQSRLALLQGGLDALALALLARPLGDVSKRHREVSGAADREPRDGRLGGELLAALPQPDDRRAPSAHATSGLRTRRESLDQLTMRAAEPLGDEDIERSADHLRLRVAEDLLGPLVEEGDALVLVDRDDRVRRQGDDPGELQFRQAERLLGPLAGRDVQFRTGHAGRSPVGVTREDPTAIEDPDPLAGVGPYPVLGLVLGLEPAKVIAERFLDPGHVVGVNVGDPGVHVRPDLVEAKASHLRPALVEHDLAGGDVPIPRAEIRAAQRELEALHGPARLFLDPLPLADVAHDALPAAAGQHLGAHFHGQVGPVRPPERPLADLRVTRDEPRLVAGEPLDLFGGEEVGDGLADEVPAVEPEHAAAGDVDVGVAAVEIRDEDAVDGLIDQLLGPRTRGLERRMHAVEGRRVDEEQEESHDARGDEQARVQQPELLDAQHVEECHQHDTEQDGADDGRHHQAAEHHASRPRRCGDSHAPQSGRSRSRPNEMRNRPIAVGTATPITRACTSR
ncbi:hypothetical protein OV079_28445 [Nannocystis pusilla]|uniref:Uncharacterized protein n=1 Tax=Nannocystis pusilla TaxID=889268 RepID=A0A9X3F0Y7_9BACT|nr:hypothetical protein [Nannocystis pusilla]MCY1009423.1 hypothetical protein [Nannocystis pusilla]